MSFMKKRTMERNVLYFMPAIVQHAKQPCGQAEQSCGQAKHDVPRIFARGATIKTGGRSRLSNAICRSLSPHIIAGALALYPLFRAIFIEHALEDHQVAGIHLDDFKTDIIGIGIYVIGMTPFTAGNKRHGSLIGNIGR
jgi:hypothetical protein